MYIDKQYICLILHYISRIKINIFSCNKSIPNFNLQTANRNMKTAFCKLQYANWNLQRETTIWNLQSLDLYQGSHSISYCLTDSVPESDLIPDWVSDSNSSIQIPIAIPIPHSAKVPKKNSHTRRKHAHTRFVTCTHKYASCMGMCAKLSREGRFHLNIHWDIKFWYGKN